MATDREWEMGQYGARKQDALLAAEEKAQRMADASVAALGGQAVLGFATEQHWNSVWLAVIEKEMAAFERVERIRQDFSR